MTLPDDTFFELMRSVLGTVKTPFNKQNLVEELSRFIARPDIQETIADYIDERDRRIIAAIALLEEPLPGELESFFTGEYSYVELQSILVNLEERLIIYRFRDEEERKGLRIALNPRLENILAKAAADTEILFPSLEYTMPETTGLNEGMNSKTLAALFAFLQNGAVLVRGEGELSFRKKTVEEGRRLFPGIDLEAAAGGLLCLGLLVQDGESFTPDETKLKAFKALDPQDRLEYLAGGYGPFSEAGTFRPGAAPGYRVSYSRFGGTGRPIGPCGKKRRPGTGSSRSYDNQTGGTASAQGRKRLGFPPRS
ncbi:hypothetical protein AGMMS50230_17270 [Spirochaetia bacterium]|nr:hypothetical protein AGMMS50230_17270 [Spirochaetia bacterium]